MPEEQYRAIQQRESALVTSNKRTAGCSWQVCDRDSDVERPCVVKGGGDYAVHPDSA